VDLAGVWSVLSDGEQDDLQAPTVDAWGHGHNLLALRANLHWAPAGEISRHHSPAAIKSKATDEDVVWWTK
jgi:hypothetical protein